MTEGDYFAALLLRLDDKVRLETRSVKYQNGDAPLIGQCHENVDRWVRENKGADAVRGWLIMAYGLERHSIVRTGDGTLIDITLPDPHYFLQHEGCQVTFDALGKNGRNQVFWSQLGIK